MWILAENTESSRCTVHHDLVAEQANFGVALDIHAFALAQFGMNWQAAPITAHTNASGIRMIESPTNQIAPTAIASCVCAINHCFNA